MEEFAREVLKDKPKFAAIKANKKNVKNGSNITDVRYSGRFQPDKECSKEILRPKKENRKAQKVKKLFK